MSGGHLRIELGLVVYGQLSEQGTRQSGKEIQEEREFLSQPYQVLTVYMCQGLGFGRMISDRPRYLVVSIEMWVGTYVDCGVKYLISLSSWYLKGVLRYSRFQIREQQSSRGVEVDRWQDLMNLYDVGMTLKMGSEN